MSIPLHEMPDLRATFQTDTGALIRQATDYLTALNEPGCDLTQTSRLRNTMHSLRGAAAMVGAKTLTALVDDYERLIEVADSFKLSARDRALQTYAFLQRQLELLRQAVDATVSGQAARVQECYEAVHREVMATWGDYFYSSAPERRQEPPPPPEPKLTAKPSRSAAKSGGARRSDADSIAREFLSSLGVLGSAAKAEPAPQAQPQRPWEQIDPEMLSYFVLETNESLAQLESLLLAWEKSPDNAEIAQSVFRLTHTIKGAANSLGLTVIGRMLHELEDLLETHVVDRVFTNLPELVETIFAVSDTIKALVREAQTRVADPASTAKATQLIHRVKALAAIPPGPARLAPQEPEFLPQASPAATGAPAALPAAVNNLDDAAEALQPAQAESKNDAAAISKTQDQQESLDHQTIRVDSDRLDLLMNLVGELVISRSRLEKKLADISRLKEEMFFGKARLFQAITDFQDKYEYSRPMMEHNRLAAGRSEPPSPLRSHPRPVAPGLEPGNLSGFSELEFDQYDEFNILARTLMEIGTDTGEIFSQLNRFFDSFGEETGQFSKITARLQDEITRVRMMPLTLLFRRLRRSARDAALKEKKEIEFVTQDNDTRLDKLILDQLYTPLLHMVRNAVSHGIEPHEARQAAGKPGAGTIRLVALCEANHVVLEISDDGQGLDLEAIRATAIQRGLLSPTATVDEETLTQFIFHPGFSTAKMVTDVSGRGIGLDVVRQEIARLSGSVRVRSIPGQGCTFTIYLPLTLAINQAMFITAGTETCALPLNFVEHIQEGQIQDVTLSGQQELVRTADGMVPLLRMHHLLNLPASTSNGAVILARVADRRVAIGVDRILRKQDIVVKPLGPLLRQHPLFSGATLGGDGQVVMIMDLPRVLENEQLSSNSAPSVTGNIAVADAPSGPARPTILVVDDSLSVRKVIEKHLLALQFDVELAIDGLDALEKLRSRNISLVLTDLEMPRMHGFELIAEMRRQEAFCRVPIVVVTSRDAEKHRRRATSLGANDYIVKPFSREQLSENINRHLNKASR